MRVARESMQSCGAIRLRPRPEAARDWPKTLASMPSTWVGELRSDSRNRGQQIACRSVVAESLADVHVQVDIAGTENEASPELKRILAQFVLPVSGGTGSFPCQ